MQKHHTGIIAALIVVLFFVSFGITAEKPGAADEATATLVEGTAQIFTKGSAAGRQLKKGDSLRRDQEVRVGDGSRVEIRFPDGTVMRLAEKSSIKLNEVYYDKKSGAKSVKVGLSVGKLWANVKKLVTTDSRVEVTTSNAVAGVRGTVYRVNAEEDKSAVVKVYDGSVFVSSPPKEVPTPASQVSGPVPVPGPHEVSPPYHEVTMEEWTAIVKAMQQISISPQGVPSKPQDFDPKADADDWVKWNQERDRQINL